MRGRAHAGGVARARVSVFPIIGYIILNKTVHVNYDREDDNLERSCERCLPVSS